MRAKTVAGTPNSRTFVAFAPLLSHATARPRQASTSFGSQARPAGRQIREPAHRDLSTLRPGSLPSRSRPHRLPQVSVRRLLERSAIPGRITLRDSSVPSGVLAAARSCCTRCPVPALSDAGAATASCWLIAWRGTAPLARGHAGQGIARSRLPLKSAEPHRATSPPGCWPRRTASPQCVRPHCRPGPERPLPRRPERRLP